MDEAQDLTEGDWILVAECAGKPGRLWLFADEEQAFWAKRRIQDDITTRSFRVRLKRPYRCPDSIQNLTDCYAGICEPDWKQIKSGVKNGVIRVVTGSEARLVRQVGKEINRLISEGLKPHEIVVLSLRGSSEPENIVHQDNIGGHPIAKATAPDAGSRIICDTFLRFKGLERPAVIVTDLRLVTSQYEKRMHIAASRAMSLLRIAVVPKCWTDRR
ncbi:MAG: hypothetical protein ABIJ57_07900, partial [Pseudomonadota bacterium]